MRSRLPHHPHWRRWAVLAILTVFLATGVSAYGFSEAIEGGVAPAAPAARRIPPPPAAAQLTVLPDAAARSVPRSFLGLSAEYWALPLWQPQMPLLERVISLLRVPGDGPFVLRVGGDSADHAFWDPHQAPMPPWAFGLAPRWLDQAGRLVSDLGIRLILDLNLITDAPAQAIQWARAAEAGLPHGSIVGFEVGNEPDIYSRAGWLGITAGKPYLGRPLPRVLTPADYVHDFAIYARALQQLAPDTTLAGPALARPAADAGWVRRLIAGDRRTLGLVTVHRYPLSACAHRGSSQYPTVHRLLSPTTSQGIATSVAADIAAAHDAGLPIRMTEVNSVTCGGMAGVSDTFATALWAPDTLFDLLRAGIDGVNLHVRADTINAPFALTPRGLTARPLLYGLILFARALGPDARLVHDQLHAAAPLNLQADAVRVGPDALHVLLIDKGRRAVRVALRLPAVGDLAVQRLTAPSPGARGQVTLGGRSLAPDGAWVGPPISQTIAPHRTGYVVTVPAFSAALIDARVAPGALGLPPARALTGARRSRAGGSRPAGGRSPQS